MKKTHFAALALLVALTASTAHAQNVTFGLDAGGAIPTSDYGDVFKPGFEGGVFADWWATPQAAIGVDVNGNFHSAKDDINNALTALSDAAGGSGDVKYKATVVQFSAHGKWKFPMQNTAMGPYLMAGLGGYNVRTKIDGGAFDGTDDSATKFGWNAGLGVDWSVSPAMMFGIAANFHAITDAFVEFNPDGTTEKKSADYVQVGATLTFTTSGATR